MSTKPPRSKTIATWLALVGGSLGAHRFYLHGFGDVWGWLHPWPTLAGLYGVRRMMELGQDDRLAWALIPLLGLMLAGTMLVAIVYGLTPDERWHERHGGGASVRHTRWGPVIGVVLGMLIGGGVLIATISFSAQRFFELQAIEEVSGSESR
jgi:hypothetical protein